VAVVAIVLVLTIETAHRLWLMVSQAKQAVTVRTATRLDKAAVVAAVTPQQVETQAQRQVVLAVTATMSQHLSAVLFSLSVLVAVAVARQVVLAAHLVLVVLAVLMQMARRLVQTRHQVAAVLAQHQR
jgi:hypothetical protein